MGRYSYESLSANPVAQQEQKTFTKIGYFRVNKDNPTAIVRFDVSTPNDLEIVDVHNMKLTTSEGKTTYKDVACLRERPEEPWKNCPLCSKNIKTLTTKVYVRLIQYETVDGKVVATPKVWARYKSFADELVNKLNMYGDLRDCLFLVTYKNDGVRGTYSVDYQPDRGIYKEEFGYTKDFSAFKDLDISKHSYCVRTFEELQEMANTGKWVKKSSKATEVVSNEVKQEVKQSEVSVQSANIQFGSVTPAVSLNKETLATAQEAIRTGTTPVMAETSNPAEGRRRRYDFEEEDLPF